MKIDLSGKRAVVTGGSRGIGRAIALACAEAGAAVSICARGAEALTAVREEIAAHRVAAHAEACDIADEVALSAYVAAAGEALGGIDILVCNASGFGTSHDEAGWARTSMSTSWARSGPSGQPCRFSNGAKRARSSTSRRSRAGRLGP